MSKIKGLHGGHKPNDSKRRWRVRWYLRHPGWTHKAWAREKRMKRLEKRLKKLKRLNETIF